MDIIRKPPKPPANPTTASEMRELTNRCINSKREMVLGQIRDSAMNGNFDYYVDSTSSSLMGYLISLGYKVELVDRYQQTYMKISWRE